MPHELLDPCYGPSVPCGISAWMVATYRFTLLDRMTGGRCCAAPHRLPVTSSYLFKPAAEPQLVDLSPPASGVTAPAAGAEAPAADGVPPSGVPPSGVPVPDTFLTRLTVGFGAASAPATGAAASAVVSGLRRPPRLAPGPAPGPDPGRPGPDRRGRRSSLSGLGAPSLSAACGASVRPSVSPL